MSRRRKPDNDMQRVYAQRYLLRKRQRPAWLKHDPQKSSDERYYVHVNMPSQFGGSVDGWGYIELINGLHVHNFNAYAIYAEAFTREEIEHQLEVARRTFPTADALAVKADTKTLIPYDLRRIIKCT